MPDSSPVSLAQHYHERTKYDPETIAQKGQGIDFSQQPTPFKEYKIGTTCDLKPYLKNLQQGLADPPSGEDFAWSRLSRFLLCSYGLTAMLPAVDGPVYLRAAPSAGGLYPAEIYLISQGSDQLPAGLYNYQPISHSLIRFWDSQQAWSVLQSACFDHVAFADTSLALVVTAIFFRSSWRYQDRAYRRICLDIGHLSGNLELAASINGYRPYWVGGFIDDAVNQLLYLDNRQEGAILVAPLVEQRIEQADDRLIAAPDRVNPQPALASPVNPPSPQIPDGELLLHFHRATCIESPTSAEQPSLAQYQETDQYPAQHPTQYTDKYNFPFCLKISTATQPIQWSLQTWQQSSRETTEETPQPPLLVALEQTILKRRSTRNYSGAELTLAELNLLLDFTYQPQHYQSQGLDPAPDYFDLSLVQTFIAVSGVTGLEAGCYYYAPHAQELRQIRFKNFRRELHYLCLGQELGRDAAVLLFHTADLGAAVYRYGDRAYRYLHMDAGHLGQRLNLAAIYLGLGVSGIGGFFDNQVNDILGIPPDEAVLYITTLGRPQ